MVMILRINFNLLVLFLLFGINRVIFSLEHNYDALRFFPELEGVKIKRVIYVNPSVIYLRTEEGYFRWTGKEWEKLFIPFTEEFPVIQLFPYDSQRFVVTYSPHEYFYYSRIAFFDGQRWQKIPAPQPYKINTVSFIDSSRFVAGGMWGSLIYYNGDSTEVLKTFPGVDYHAIWAFEKDNFLALVSGQNIHFKGQMLIHFNNSNWAILTKMPESSLTGYCWRPDSGLFVGAKGFLYLYEDTTIRKISDLKTRFFSHLINPVERTLYFWHDKAFWETTILGEKIKLFDFPYPAKIFPVQDGGFFILRANHIFYKGPQDIGVLFNQDKPFFKYWTIGNNKALGLSLYETENKEFCVYLVVPDEINRFFKLKFPAKDMSLLLEREEILFNTGLLEYDKQKGIFDGSLGFADLDNDGDRDAFLASLAGQSLFFENIGKDRFRDITAEVGLKIIGRVNRFYFVDFNLDGLLDLVLGDELGPLRFIRNLGYMRFEDVTDLLNLPDDYTTYLPALADMDGDGDADLFLYSLYRPLEYFENIGIDDNNKLPLFKNRSSRSPQLRRSHNYFIQSISFADYDNDGDLDILLANRNSPLKLFENLGGHRFRDVSRQRKVNYNFFSYGASWGDLDWDGYLDFVLSTLGKNYIFWNVKGKYFRIDSTTFSENGLSYTTGSAIVDSDQDGDLDILFSNYLISSDRIYLNLLNKESFIRIQLRGGSKSNFEGIGGIVRLYESGYIEDPTKLVGFRYIQPETGYNSFQFPYAYFGVDPSKVYDAVIQFPGGKTVQTFNLVPGNSYLIKEISGINQILFSFVQAGKNWIFRTNKRIQIYKLLMFLGMFIGFNLFIHLRSYWPVIYVFFFNTILFSTYLVMEIFFFTINPLLSWIFPFYFVFISGAIAYWTIEKYTMFKYGDEFNYELFDLFRQFQHSKSGLAQINHLIFFCSNIKQSTESEMLREFLKELFYFKTFTVPFINNVLHLTSRVKNLRSTSIEAIRLLRLISQMLHVIDYFHNPSPKKFAKMKELLLRLKTQLLLLRKETELAVSCDAILVISQTLRGFPEFTEVKFHREPAEQVPRAIIPEEVLSRVLGDLFQNALDAMHQQETKKIDIFVRGETERLVINIHDYGIGISPNFQNKIFDENFSTKGSSGLGLYHARKLLKRFGGEIQLLESSEKKGTTFQLLLKGVTDV